MKSAGSEFPGRYSNETENVFNTCMYEINFYRGF